MMHFREMDNVYLDESLVGFTRKLTEDGVVKRQVDLLLMGAAYAIRHQLHPLGRVRRHELIRVASLDPDVRLALESSLVWYARERGLPSPETPKDLLDLLARSGSAGLMELKKDWEVLSPGQIRLRLLELGKNPEIPNP